MSEPDASFGEMPGFPLPGRLGRELNESLLDALLSGQVPPDAPEELRTVAEMLAGLAGPAEPGELAGDSGELAGETDARSAYTRLASPVGVSQVARPARRKHPRRAVPRSAWLAAVLVAAAAGLGGTAAAAYAGVLPGPVQDFAHHTIGAPPAHHAGHPQPQPVKHQPRDPATVTPTGPKAPTTAKPAKPQPAKPAKAQPAKPAKPARAQPAKPTKTTNGVQLKSPKPPGLSQRPRRPRLGFPSYRGHLDHRPSAGLAQER